MFKGKRVLRFVHVKSLLLFFLLTGYLDLKSDALSPSDLVIVLPENPDAVKTFAAAELKTHLDLISEKNIKITGGKSIPENAYPIFIGIPFPEDHDALSPEEARYTITSKGTYIYGDDKISVKAQTDTGTVLDEWNNRTGTLFAVYFFLENELAFLWTEPGDKGIVYTPVKDFNFTDRKFSWIPSLTQRRLRPTVYPNKANAISDKKLKEMPTWLVAEYRRASGEDLPEGFIFSENDGLKRSMDEKIWLRRMKMGRSITLSYGHAFTNWWGKYGKTHPEFFALNAESKKRAPDFQQGGPERIKLCVSNHELHKEIINQWLLKKYIYLNACENDSGGYCTCPACMTLDVKIDAKEFGYYMTDRYIWFANQLLKMAREKEPNVKVVMYAYGDMLIPPGREKVSSGIVLGIVPDNLLIEKDALNKIYAGWKNVSASDFFLRPNDMEIEIAMPMGFEKKLFENFEVGIKNGVFGTDYDRISSCWETSGMANYILARAHSFPNKSFEKWEDEYCSVYGSAKNDIKEYYQYWRTLWEKRIYPEREEITKAGRYGNFRRGLMWKFSEYYKPEDFDETDKILERAASRKLNDKEKERLARLILANKHSRLTCEAVITMADKKSSPVEKINAADKLLKFRIKNVHVLQMNWPFIFSLEKQFGDLAGIIKMQQLQRKLKPNEQQQ